MRPLIAMPSRHTPSADTWRVPATALGLPYQQAITRAGGIPIAVPPLFDRAAADEVARDVVAAADAVCLPGGPDVDPARYGAGAVHPKVWGVRGEHDTLDIALARAAVEAGRPLLAICRGHQALNVALGGTLHQHLPDVIGDELGASHFKHHNDIDLVPGSKAALAMGTERPRGHCVHHQAIDRLGDGLVVTAWAGDVIEGVELPGHWVVGVQWHPEDDAATDPQQQSLFDDFLAATRDLATR
jgi:putative glutamine amidotransferase